MLKGMNNTERTSVTVSAKINAPVKKVWERRTSPEHITKWNHASDDWHSPNAVNDLREGGKFCYEMAAKDGSMSFDFEGVYTKVVPHELIEYIMDDGRKVKITFEETGEGVLVTETFDAEQMNPVEMQRAGWQAIMDNFKKHTES